MIRKKVKYGKLTKTESYAFDEEKVYLLGKNGNGTKYWLKAPSWDCNWYWRFGYIVTYEGNCKPEDALDLNLHTHADNFMDWCIEWSGKKPVLKETTFSEHEAWKLSELFKRFYMFEDLAAYYRRGSVRICELNDNKTDKEESKRINEVEIPYITEKIINILKE